MEPLIARLARYYFAFLPRSPLFRENSAAGNHELGCLMGTARGFVSVQVRDVEITRPPEDDIDIRARDPGQSLTWPSSLFFSLLPCVVASVGGYDGSFPVAQDTIYWLSLSSVPPLLFSFPPSSPLVIRIW